MKKYWEDFKSYLNSHPKLKAGLIVAEGAALGAISDAINSYLSGGHTSFKGVVTSVAIAVYIAVKNYATQNAGWSLTEKKDENKTV